MTRTGDREIGVVSRRLPDNPGGLACMRIPRNLKGRKENKGMRETRGDWGKTIIFSRAIASLSTCHHYYLRAWIMLDQKAAKCANVRPVNGFCGKF